MCNKEWSIFSRSKQIGNSTQCNLTNWRVKPAKQSSQHTDEAINQFGKLHWSSWEVKSAELFAKRARAYNLYHFILSWSVIVSWSVIGSELWNNRKGWLLLFIFIKDGSILNNVEKRRTRWERLSTVFLRYLLRHLPCFSASQLGKKQTEEPRCCRNDPDYVLALVHLVLSMAHMADTLMFTTILHSISEIMQLQDRWPGRHCGRASEKLVKLLGEYSAIGVPPW